MEETFGIPNLRELKGKKNKTSNRAARSKKSEARKFEAKKQQRQRLEKDLQANMESYVTRSVMDADVEFKLPDHAETMPITIKWSTKDIRSTLPDNADGYMDPELLLQYSIERISLPCGDGVFRWLSKQPTMHSYFVHLFWFIKVKFFQRDSGPEAEKFLLENLSVEYVKIVELLSRHAHEEHEKDLVFKYLPYIISNAIFYGFFFLCPGSRHLYTKGFRKTILLQIVQVMNGVQLCPISVKVSWIKLFPEEAQDEEDGEDGDLFPTNTISASNNSNNLNPSNSNLMKNVGGTNNSPTVGGNTGVGVDGKPPAFTPQSTVGLNNDVTAMMMTSKSLPVGLLETDGDSPVKIRLDGTATSEDLKQFKSRMSSDVFSDNNNINLKNSNDPLSRTVLKPPLLRPGRNTLAPRQRKELVNANDMSPLMQEYLSATTSGGGKRIETLRRTVPVGWCVSGGSDTHHRKVIPRELHDELSLKCKQAKKAVRMQSILAQREQLKSIREVEKTCAKVLAGGAATVGRFSLDLVKRRKNPRAAKEIDRENDTGTAEAAADEDDFDHFLM